MTVAAPESYRWSRRMYDEMATAEILGPDTRVQLIDGEIIEMTPPGSRHTAVTHLIADRLRVSCPADTSVRIQSPLALDDYSEPEPDVALVRGAITDYLDHHPATALLVIEVSDTSLGLDRTRKQRIYAKNAIPEYWVVNLAEAAIEVHRDPEGETYQDRRVVKGGDTLSPLACPGATLAVADLLP